ncbi:response regulator transcription factor [Clostridium arbusti]|uniref:response regulator transcription factor n=1 Tax=Clostridium arbusti TaxID=1137848 RepID=UPI00028918EB|nr:response regulator [Clostridium arbusti]
MYSILLVDDEKLQREALKIILENFIEDIEIIGEARNGTEAIEVDEKLNPDIIFMDIKMPGLDGIKASEIIKRKNQNKIIIMVTAYDNFNLVRKSLVLGVNDYILKPFKNRELLEILNTQINNLKINREKIKENYTLNFRVNNEEKVRIGSGTNKVLEPALKYIEENYREEISLEKIAHITNLSVYYFSRLFKKQMGISFITYISRYKMDKAKELLENTDIPIVNIAAELGYYECGYFTKVFKKITGTTPSKYRNDNNKE